jgi:deoxycytidylate deaminase
MDNPYPTMPEDGNSSSGHRHARYMNILSKIAADLSPVRSARLAACVVYKNDIVSFGVNEMKSHPFQARYGKNKDSVFLHAETSAIKNALRTLSYDELERSTLYVCRVRFIDFNKRGMIFGMAKPCNGCFRCINTFNIKNVIYSLDNLGFSRL